MYAEVLLGQRTEKASGTTEDQIEDANFFLRALGTSSANFLVGKKTVLKLDPFIEALGGNQGPKCMYLSLREGKKKQWEPSEAFLYPTPI